MALAPFTASLFDFPFGRGLSRDPLDIALAFPSLGSLGPTVTAHPLDVIETPNAFKITVDTPGMGADDIHLTMQEGILTISGKKKTETEERDKGGRVLRRERAFASFSRSFTLPEGVEEERITAGLHQGVLTVTVPKVAPAPKPEPKRIAIQTTPQAEEAPGVRQGTTTQ